MTAASGPNRQDDERRLAELLASPTESQDFDREAIGIVYQHLYTTLRPLLRAKYGRQLGEQNASTRFTELLNEFFVGVLEKAANDQRPAVPSDVDTGLRLRNYVSRALTNLFLDHYRRKKRGQKVAQELDYLLRDFELYFKHDCPTLDYERALDQFERWEVGSDREQKWATVLRGKYVEGLTPEEIQRALQISQPTYYRLHQAAVDELKKLLSR